MSVVGNVFANLVIKRPARKLRLPDLITKLEASGKVVEARCAAASDTEKNRAALRHIVGIERWGGRRLETLLGKAAVGDEYDDYQPAATQSWRDLRAAFGSTRRNTIALARRLDKEAAADEPTARHNSLGDFSAREWLYYLDGHASRESRRIR